MKSFFTLFALTLLTTSLAHARLPVNEILAETVSEKFFQDANNQETGLGQAVSQILGRKLMRSDYEVIALSTQTMRNPWAFSYYENEEKACVAGDSNAEFLILLRVKIKNPNAATFATYSFKVNAEQALVAVHKDGFDIDNCVNVSENDGTYVISEAINLVGGYEYVEIKAPAEEK